MTVPRYTLLGIALISSIVNLLALTAPLFMLQVYDRVLASRSVSTLIALVLLVGGLLAFQALLDVVRGRVLLRIGENFDAQMSGQVHAAVMRLPLRMRVAGDGLLPLRDLDNVRGFLAGQGPAAFFDLPWIPIYIAICFAFHFWIGFTALAGAVVLVILALLTAWMSWKPTRDVTSWGAARNKLMEAGRRNAEVVRAMGFEHRLAQAWQETNTAFLSVNRKAGDITGGMGGISRALRIMLQSGILAVGAYLVIAQEITPGVMIAASIMMGRALAPVDLAIASWRAFLTARQSWVRMRETLAFLNDDNAAPMQLPEPKQQLAAEGVNVVPPGTTAPVLNGVSFTVNAGSALGIIGPSGSGKTCLVRTLVGVWPPARGKVRLDGAALDQWDATALGTHIGYLPQDVELFEGTIAQNIARFEVNPDPDKIVAAARAAKVHDLVVRFPDGYDTQIGEAGSALSAGQCQRIGLARALYGEPFLVVLDEPNAHLDAEGEAAVIEAIAGIRRRGGIAVVIAHRPSALQAADFVLMLEKGKVRDFGPKDEVLGRVLKSEQPRQTAERRPERQAAPDQSSIVAPLDAALERDHQNVPATGSRRKSHVS